MTKQCELCDRPARMHCESDQASLCWACDAKVHGANFLVARHTRILLCRSCQAPTPWRASGSRLGPTVSVCERCLRAGACDVEKGEAGGGGGRIESEVEGVGDLGVEDDDEEKEEDEDEDEDEVEEDEEEEDEEDEDGDNQVVPWSTETEATAVTPPPVESCSSSEESSSGRMAICGGFLRRMRENGNSSTSHWQEDDLGRGCPPSQPGCLRPSPPPAAVAAVHSGRMPGEHDAETSSAGGPLRHRKRTALPPGPAASAYRLRRDRLPRGDPGTVDFHFPDSPSPPI